MVGQGGVAGVSGLTAILFGTSLLGQNEPPTLSPYTAVEVAPSGMMFADWGEDDQMTDCEFWNGTFYYSPTACDPFAVSRISPNTATYAVNRALKCGAKFDTHCILNGEIGFGAPAAFLYDEADGYRMLLAPKLLPFENGTQKHVRMQDPSTNSANVIMWFNESINVEFLQGGSRAVLTETLTGPNAYCVQTLIASVIPSCWASLDG